LVEAASLLAGIEDASSPWIRTLGEELEELTALLSHWRARRSS
jgi:hypothetical protein